LIFGGILEAKEVENINQQFGIREARPKMVQVDYLSVGQVSGMIAAAIFAGRFSQNN